MKKTTTSLFILLTLSTLCVKGFSQSQDNIITETRAAAAAVSGVRSAASVDQDTSTLETTSKGKNARAKAKVAKEAVHKQRGKNCDEVSSLSSDRSSGHSGSRR